MQKMLTILLVAVMMIAAGNLFPGDYKVIEDFEAGYVDLISFSERDINPDAWVIDSTNTYNDSSYSLKLFGTTWKLLEIEPIPLDNVSVWQVACYVQTVGGIQAFGITDGRNVLFYSFAGKEKLDTEEWLTTYQGFYPVREWVPYQLPVGDDWLAWHRYKPEITGIIFINDDMTYNPPGVVNFDYITDITSMIPQPPKVHISFTVAPAYRGEDKEFYFGVQFNSKVSDPFYARHHYFWEFGDGEFSGDMQPAHIYKIGDEHTYTAFLTVENGAGRRGYASAQIPIPEAHSSLPLKMNFVGDVMLARRFEEPGGIIPMLGVEAIFEPTLHLLGDAADITVINFESPVTTATVPHPTKGIGFKGRPENVQGLVYAGVDVASLANNHILDYMLPGLQETQAVLDSVGILHLGAGATAYEAYLPAFINKKGVNVAFIASSDRTGQYNNFQPYLDAGFDRPGFAMLTPYYVKKQIESVRKTSDLVVALLHSGSEYSLGPISHYDVEMNAYEWTEEPYRIENGVTVPSMDTPKMWDSHVRRFILDSGADLVINHHPHIFQGVELYRGRLIAHSLGNFIFDSNYPETMPSMILNAEADKEGFNAFSITPIYIDRYIPKEATGQLGLHILDYLARRSRELDTYLHIDREKNRAYVIMDTLHIDYYDIEDEGFLVFDHYDDYTYRSQPFRFQRASHLSKLHYLKPMSNYSYRLGREMIWFGNFEDEGCTLLNTEQPDVIYDETVPYEGSRSLRLTRDANAPSMFANLRNRVRKYNADGWTLHGYVKTENAAGVNVEVRYYSTRFGTVVIGNDILTLPISGTTDWTYYHQELNIPANATSIDILFRSTGPDSLTGYAWFDNVGIIEWEEWEDYQNDLEVICPNDYYYIQLETEDDIEVAFLNYTERVFEQGFPPIPPTSVEEESPVALNPAELFNSYPNPFNAETNIRFKINEAGKVKLTLYNIKGQRVTTLFDDNVEKGSFTSLIWDGKDQSNRDVASGVYFYRLTVNDQVIDTKKCLLLK